MSALENGSETGAVTTRFKHKVQLLLCDGCCCGKEGHAEVPFKVLQSEWTRRKLVKEVHLTSCYCLGPCDAANVVCVLSANGATWFGNLEEVDDYAAVLDWAQTLTNTPDLLALPERLRGKTLKRFVSTP